MALISKNSLEILKDKVDLVEIISSYIKLSRSGSHYKALCPFHSEKSPSFSISLGDKYYHCFGCGAHGDAISFLMEYAKLSFKEALSFLADKYQVTLENDQEDDSQKVLKKQLKEALSLAEDFYHFCLLHTKEGQKALDYASARGLNIEFLRTFKIGFSPKNGMLTRFLKSQSITSDVMIEAGLLHPEKKQDFFFERFMIPIHDAMGQCIGFSARKLDPDSFGGKYINTPETPLFKKSHVLFGLKFSRARIIKDKKALICEGQIDAMRLIFEGYDYTVASQGTAFGVAHVQILKQLGVNLVYLAFDGDHAGIQAALKVGEHFMQAQISVQVVILPLGKDPDSFLIECGKKGFDDLLHTSKSYLEFLYDTLKIKYDLNEPSEKNRFINEIKKAIQAFNDPILIYESLKKLAILADVPERLLGIYGTHGFAKNKQPQQISINKEDVLDKDVLRFYFLLKLQNLKGTELFIKNEIDFESSAAKRLFEAIKGAPTLEMIPFLASLDADLHQLFETLFDKKINRLKLYEGAKEVVSKILERSWLAKRQGIQEQIAQAQDEKEQLKLTLKLTMLIKSPPQLVE